MAHIHTDVGDHDLTVGAYIVRTDFDEPKLMLHWHKKLNKWLQFGGHVEIKENPWGAITHELLEESGYELEQLRVLQPKDRLHHLTGAILHPQPFNVNTHPFNDEHFHTVLEYVFVTDEEPQGSVADDESTKFGYFSRAELLEVDKEEIFPDTLELCVYLFDVCVPNWDQVSTTS